jgi:hypothetical protein
VADLVEALGYSAFRAGDAVGLLAFDDRAREDLYVPARHSRGNGSLMARMLRECQPGRAASHSETLAGLRRATESLVGRSGLVFLASDFHWPTDALGTLLAQFAPACVVPLLVWDPAEIEPPDARALVALSDAETGARRSLWMRDSLRTRWRDAVATRRAELTALFNAQGMPPFDLQGRFDAEALTRYFMETAA